MLREILSPGSFLTFLARDPQTESSVVSDGHDQPISASDSTPTRTIAELRMDALESMDDAELARLGLSRGVLALRAGCPDRL